VPAKNAASPPPLHRGEPGVPETLRTRPAGAPLEPPLLQHSSGRDKGLSFLPPSKERRVVSVKNASPPPLCRGEKPGLPASLRTRVPWSSLGAAAAAHASGGKNSHPPPVVIVEGTAQTYRAPILAAPDFLQYATPSSSTALPST
jgi:hypothetical protein